MKKSSFAFRMHVNKYKLIQDIQKISFINDAFCNVKFCQSTPWSIISKKYGFLQNTSLVSLQNSRKIVSSQHKFDVHIARNK